MSAKSLHRTKGNNSSRWIISFLVVFQLIGLPLNILAAHLVGQSSSEHADFTFLTKVNESSLHQNDYHIIDISIPSKQASYIMHLSKPDDLFTPEHLGIHHTEAQHYECTYTGTITSSSGQPVGMASLSSCLHETAFEGLMHLENQHYQITPSHHHRFKRSNKGGPNSSKVSLNHNLTKPKASPNSNGSRRGDSPTVPKNDLKDARAQMLKDQNGLKNELVVDDDDSDPNQGSNSINQTVSTSNGFETRMQTKQTSKKALSRVIELAVFTDQSFYNTWKELHPKDTVKQINKYLLAFVNNMNFLYQQPSMSPKISFRLVHVGIQKTVPSGLTPTPDTSIYLKSVCTWAGDKDTNGTIWDHAMMLTSMPLVSKSSGSSLGVAYTSTMCLRYWSCSLVQYTKGFESMYTAAHELGHSLGMLHDGEDMNTKCDPSKYLMGAVADAGQINWSQCSRENINNFLTSGDPSEDVKDPNNVPTCLTKRGSKKVGIKYRTGKFPGKIFTVKKQCQQVCDGCTAYLTKSAPYNDVCKSLHCKMADGQIRAVHPALEGTACGQGNKKLCRNGKCQ